MTLVYRDPPIYKNFKNKVMKKIVGIDISKDSFDTAYLDEQGKMVCQKWEYKNVKDINLFLDQLEKGSCLVMEATGVYHKRLAYMAVERSFKVCVENPSRIKFYSKMQNSITKTDKNDGQLILNYALDNERHLKYFELPKESAEQLSQLQMYQSGLKKEIQRSRNRLESIQLHPEKSERVEQMLKEDIERLEGRIKDVQKEMRQITKKDFKNYYKILMSVPGIGEKTTVALICAFNGFCGWDDPKLIKRFIKFLGLAPVIHQSGRSVNKKTHISRSGAPDLRSKLYMGASSAVFSTKNSNIMSRYYEKKRKDGKSHKEAMIAVMHKMVRVAIALVRDNCMFDENKHGLAK